MSTTSIALERLRLSADPHHSLAKRMLVTYFFCSGSPSYKGLPLRPKKNGHLFIGA
jgi:hypothetical protein